MNLEDKIIDANSMGDGDSATFYEVNLRLDVIGADNSKKVITSQLRKALGSLRKLGRFEYVCDPYPIGVGSCHVLIAKVHKGHWDRQAIHDLSVQLRQRCISVYSESKKHGELIGPDTAQYNSGRFDLNHFTRFDPHLLRTTKYS